MTKKKSRVLNALNADIRFLKTLNAVVLAIALTTIGCAAIKTSITVALVQAFVDHVITGQWTKPGATSEDYYKANWECQRTTSWLDAEKGMQFDLKAYYDCMVKDGWRLQQLDASPLVK